MSPTRRDVLKMAAALPAIGSALTRADALAELRKPVIVEPELDDRHPDVIFDPASFASKAANGSIYDRAAEAGVNQAAEPRAAYVKARFELIQLFPEFAEKNLPIDHPFIRMDECMWWIANESYSEGIRAGAAYESLRRAIVAPTQMCRRCEGLGLLDRKGGQIWDYDRPNPNDTRPCPDCKATGLVAAEFLKGWTR